MLIRIPLKTSAFGTPHDGELNDSDGETFGQLDPGAPIGSPNAFASSLGLITLFQNQV